MRCKQSRPLKEPFQRALTADSRQPTGYVGYFTALLGKYNATFKIVLNNRTRGRTGTPPPTISPSASFAVLATSIPAFAFAAFAVFESFINAAHWSEQLRLSRGLVILVAGGVLSLRCALAVVWLPGRVSHCHKEGRGMGRHCTRSRDCHCDVTAKGDKLSSYSLLIVGFEDSREDDVVCCHLSFVCLFVCFCRSQKRSPEDPLSSCRFASK